MQRTYYKLKVGYLSSNCVVMKAEAGLGVVVLMDYMRSLLHYDDDDDDHGRHIIMLFLLVYWFFRPCCIIHRNKPGVPLILRCCSHLPFVSDISFSGASTAYKQIAPETSSSSHLYSWNCRTRKQAVRRRLQKFNYRFLFWFRNEEMLLALCTTLRWPDQFAILQGQGRRGHMSRGKSNISSALGWFVS